MGPTLEIMVQGDGAVTSHTFREGDEVLVGRASSNGLHLEHAAVSRKHARFLLSSEGWILEDLDSSHGTWINGRRITGGEQTRIGPGDVIQIRPWALIVRKARTNFDSSVEVEPDGQLVRPVVEPLVKRRLDAVLEIVRELQSLEDEQAIADRIVEGVLQAAEVDRAAIVRMDGEEIDPVSVRLQDSLDSAVRRSPLSRTLVRAALEGDLVRLDECPEAQGAESIVDAGLSQALCVPIDLGNGPELVLYTDAWRGGLEDGELVAWCDALAQLCAIAIGNHRQELTERDRARMALEMSSARAAQEMLLPVRSGVHGPFTWSVCSIPGLEVAGDLVDITPLAEGGLGLMVGDVSGKGARAGIVMASIQAYAAAVLDGGGSPSQIIQNLDDWAERMVPDDVFITLWKARLYPDGMMEWVDAGHGWADLRRADGTVEQLPGPHRPPVGIDRIEAHGDRIQLQPGDSVVLVSDGVIEQPAPNGERFGRDRLEEMLSRDVSPAGIVSEIERWAGTGSFEDDLTIVSMAYRPSGMA
ncbi:MAG: SpoIIE family protein phosphatase [Phycisphaerales bacterium]|nr:SpoIIE family protein phosphatase [Phycisphaerales bacterium]